MSTRTNLSKAKKHPRIHHYSLFGWKTLCGLDAVRGEDVLSDKTACKPCLKEAAKQHYQLALLANKLFKRSKQ